MSSTPSEAQPITTKGYRKNLQLSTFLFKGTVSQKMWQDEGMGP
jgi:hypothetical protein